MRFKFWLEANQALDQISNRFFSRRDTNRQMDPNVIFQALGMPLNSPLKVFNTKGSTATIYEYPGDPSKLIKVTGDMNDARSFNLLLRRGIKSPNVVRFHQVVKLPGKAAAIVVDKINGKPMIYSTSMLTALIQGVDYSDSCEGYIDIKKGKPDRVRDEILNRYGKNTLEERSKLAELFKTLCRLSQIGIDMFDFDGNILDAGTSYVIVDLGQ